MTLNVPELHWSEGQAVNQQYQDGYFSRAGGLPESEHVFIRGNELERRFGETSRFCIGELGFGTGLNFLLTQGLWMQRAQVDAQLDYIAIEASPLAPAEIRRALAPWPELSDAAKHLIDVLPERAAGYHTCQINERVRLILLYGDIATVLPSLRAQVDAWYLDGFAPSRNPAMWSSAALHLVARRTRPGGTFATYTAASAVRRTLSACGFLVHKLPGFGRKREMLAGQLPAATARHPEWLEWPRGSARKLIVLGSGIAGACLARQLAEWGLSVTLISDDQAASTQIPAFLVRRYAEAQASPSHRLYGHAFATALAFYRKHCPTAITEFADQDVARLNGKIAIHELLAHPRISHERATIKSLTLKGAPENPLWTLEASTGQTFCGDAVILCTATIPQALSLQLPITPCSGQVIVLNHALREPFANSIHGIPLSAGCQIGSSYRPGDSRTDIRPVETAELLEKARTHTGDLATDEAKAAAFAGIRQSSLDHLPLIGPAPDLAHWAAAQRAFESQRTPEKRRPSPVMPGLWLNLAHGSRGATMAPLAAQLLASHLSDRPVPLESELLDALHPGRFATRSIRRGQPLESCSEG